MDDLPTRLRSFKDVVNVGINEKEAMVAAADRIEELESIVRGQAKMLHNIATEAGFKAGDAYTWISIVNRLRKKS